MGFPRQGYWSGLPGPLLGDLSDPGVQLASILYAALPGVFFTTSTIWKAPQKLYMGINRDDTFYWASCCQVASVVSDSVRPHRQQPIRLRLPWDSPGKSTGVGCHFLLQCMKVKSESEVTQCVRCFEKGLKNRKCVIIIINILVILRIFYWFKWSVLDYWKMGEVLK